MRFCPCHAPISGRWSPKINIKSTTTTWSVCRALLYSTKWDSQVLLESYYSDPERMFKTAGLIDPDTIQMELGDDGVGQECDICCLGPDEESSPFLSNDLCGHSFCLQCWAQHVKSKVEEGLVLRLCCPASSCNTLLSDNLVEQVVGRDEELLLKLTTKKAEAVVDRSPSLVWCPPGGCQGVVRLPADSLRSSSYQCIVLLHVSVLFCNKLPGPLW